MRTLGVLWAAMILSALPVTVNPHDTAGRERGQAQNHLEAKAVLSIVLQVSPDTQKTTYSAAP